VIADAYLQCQRYDQGLRAVDEGLAFVESRDERFYEGELHRLRGELALAAHVPGAAQIAETAFRRALDVTAAQGARRLTLRAATSFARLQHVTPDERRACLEGAIDVLAEGLDLPDLRAARDAMSELK